MPEKETLDHARRDERQGKAPTMKLSKLDFQKVLAAPGRALEIPESADAYGWLVGDWELDVLHYWGTNVASRGIKGEVHAHWVLEGRAVQDVWIMPRRSDRIPELDKRMNMYGTTLRLWDATIEGWHIIWANPAGDHYETQIGRRCGNDVVQIGNRLDNTSTRWTFTEITPASFHWRGEAQEAGQPNLDIGRRIPRSPRILSLLICCRLQPI